MVDIDGYLKTEHRSVSTPLEPPIFYFMTLAQIQQQVKAPKGQYNSFGKYKYRSAEDIVEAVKLVINPLGFWLVLTDDVVMIGDRIYVKATAILTNGETTYSTTAFAREEEVKKGMDGSQVTGAASSYARKYALNGLFAIDDTKDSDATNEHRDEVGISGRDKLNALLETSSYDERQRAGLKLKIAAITSTEDYERALANLNLNQADINSVTNPSQKDINQKLKSVQS